jgi:hypothetical protein
VPEPPDTERRLTTLEARVEDVAAEASVARQDAAAARHLAATHDRDLADLGVKVDANRRAINSLGVQTAARFDRVDKRFDGLEAEMRAGFAETGRGFAEMRGRLDGAAAGYQHIVELLDTLLRDDER